MTEQGSLYLKESKCHNTRNRRNKAGKYLLHQLFHTFKPEPEICWLDNVAHLHINGVD